MTNGRSSAEKGKLKRTAGKQGAAISVAEFLSLKAPKGDLILAVRQERVSLTSLERVYWPDEKITKFDLLCYYIQISPIHHSLFERPSGHTSALAAGHKSANVFPTRSGKRTTIRQASEAAEPARTGAGLCGLHYDGIAPTFSESGNNRTASLALDD